MAKPEGKMNRVGVIHSISRGHQGPHAEFRILVVDPYGPQRLFSHIPFLIPMFRLLTYFVLVSFVAFPGLAEEEGTYARSIQHLEPMDLGTVEPSLANVLRYYYAYSFGDSSNWEAIQSIRFVGIVNTAKGSVRFSAFKKKPDYSKVVLFLGEETRHVMAFDGRDAWQLSALEPGAEPVAMPEDEARNFIRDATTGGHLLYSGMEAKRMELLRERAEFDGKRYYEIHTTLPDGQRIRHYLNESTFAEERQIKVNQLNGQEETTVYSDFRRVNGLRIPYKSTLFVGGEQVHEVNFSKVHTNVGAMPWIFARPSGAYLPGDTEERLKIPASDFSTLAKKGIPSWVELDAVLHCRIGESIFDAAPSGFEADPELFELGELLEPEWLK